MITQNVNHPFICYFTLLRRPYTFWAGQELVAWAAANWFSVDTKTMKATGIDVDSFIMRMNWEEKNQEKVESTKLCREKKGCKGEHGECRIYHVGILELLLADVCCWIYIMSWFIYQRSTSNTGIAHVFPNSKHGSRLTAYFMLHSTLFQWSGQWTVGKYVQVGTFIWWWHGATKVLHLVVSNTPNSSIHFHCLHFKLQFGLFALLGAFCLCVCRERGSI